MYHTEFINHLLVADHTRCDNLHCRSRTCGETGIHPSDYQHLFSKNILAILTSNEDLGGRPADDVTDPGMGGCVEISGLDMRLLVCLPDKGAEWTA